MIMQNHTPPHVLKENKCRGGSEERWMDVPSVPSNHRSEENHSQPISAEKEDSLPPFETLEQLLERQDDRQAEWSYRDGYFTGWLHCARAIVRLYNKGYVRPKDIATVLESHDAALRRWRDSAEKEEPLEMGEPKFSAESWHDLRRAVFERDNMACTKCGNRQKLEAHHVEPVSEGGLSVMGNLVTLCRKCHRGF